MQMCLCTVLAAFFENNILQADMVKSCSNTPVLHHNYPQIPQNCARLWGADGHMGERVQTIGRDG